MNNEVREFIQWYSAYQYDNGKVPCVVDARGLASAGERQPWSFIYLIREYFNFTHDTAFLRSNNEHVLKAVDYIETLIAERSTSITEAETIASGRITGWCRDQSAEVITEKSHALLLGRFLYPQRPERCR